MALGRLVYRVDMQRISHEVQPVLDDRLAGTRNAVESYVLSDLSVWVLCHSLCAGISAHEIHALTHHTHHSLFTVHTLKARLAKYRGRILKFA